MLQRPTRSPAPSSLVCDEVLEDAFLAWARDPAKPDTVRFDGNRHLTMLELSHRLRYSNARLSGAAIVQLGLTPDATIATAVTALLQATVEPDGPRCRSFRSACLYLRGLAWLEVDPATEAAAPRATNGSAPIPSDTCPGASSQPDVTPFSRARRVEPASSLKLLRGPALLPALGARRAHSPAAPPEKEHA